MKTKIIFKISSDFSLSETSETFVVKLRYFKKTKYSPCKWKLILRFIAFEESQELARVAKNNENFGAREKKTGNFRDKTGNFEGKNKLKKTFLSSKAS